MNPTLAQRLAAAAPPPGAARALTLAVVVQTVGFGLLMTLSALYFVLVKGLSVTDVGVGMTVAAIGGVLAGVAVGHLSDRIEARALLAGLLVVAAGAVLAHLLVDTFLSFVLVVSGYQFVDRGAATVRGALVARAVPAELQVRTRSYMRAVSNIGFAAGTSLAAIALALDSTLAFSAMIGVAAASYLVAATIVNLRVPRVAAVADDVRLPIWTVTRDGRFMRFATLNAVLSLQFAVLEFAMPIWVAQSTAAPLWMVTVLWVLNTILVTTLQVRMGHSSVRLDGAIRTTVTAGTLLALACVAFGAAAHLPVLAAVVLLVVAGVTHTFGEMLQGASSWSIAYELSPASAHGQYQGMFSSSTSVGLVAGSSVIAFVVLGHGLAGWLTLAALFAAAGMLTPLALRGPSTAAQPHREGDPVAG